MEKPVSILWKPEKFTSRNTKIPARSALSARMRPEPPSRADHRAAKQADAAFESNDITMKIKCFPDRRAHRAENFHFLLFFMSGRNPGASACPDLILPEWAGRKARQIVHALIPSCLTGQNPSKRDMPDAFQEQPVPLSSVPGT